MRIVAGIHRSRKILPPKDTRTTRPITDRVKTALFDRLGARGRLEGGNALDIFAGTGSMGLEAISRGVDHCAFIERDRDARRRLGANLKTLDIGEQATIMSADALAAAWIRLLPRQPLSVVFCDPPYRMTRDDRDRGRIINQIARLAAVCEAGAVLTVRTDDHTDLPAADGWDGPQVLDYGSMHIHWYERRE